MCVRNFSDLMASESMWTGAMRSNRNLTISRNGLVGCLGNVSFLVISLFKKQNNRIMCVIWLRVQSWSIWIFLPHISLPVCRSMSGLSTCQAGIWASHLHQGLGWTSSWSLEPFLHQAGSLNNIQYFRLIVEQSEVKHLPITKDRSIEQSYCLENNNSVIVK